MYREHHVWQPHSMGSDRLAIFIDKRLQISFICKRQNLEQKNIQNGEISHLNTPTTLQDALTLALKICNISAISF
jgi:hypothetical protein